MYISNKKICVVLPDNQGRDTVSDWLYRQRRERYG